MIWIVNNKKAEMPEMPEIPEIPEIELAEIKVLEALAEYEYALAEEANTAWENGKRGEYYKLTDIMSKIFEAEEIAKTAIAKR